LANRRLFAEQLHRAIDRTGRDGQGVALLFCDLDDFKPVNDSFGHDTGDVVLTAVAERMRAAVRGTDLVARLGGDEFVVLVEGFADRTELVTLADRLIAELGHPVTAGPSRGDRRHQRWRRRGRPERHGRLPAEPGRRPDVPGQGRRRSRRPRSADVADLAPTSSRIARSHRSAGAGRTTRRPGCPGRRGCRWAGRVA
jgi:GGDEF domain-containing protein